MATRSPKENLWGKKGGGGSSGKSSGKQPKRKPEGKKLNRELAVNCTKVQPTAKCSTS